jgi:citrate synthase
LIKEEITASDMSSPFVRTVEYRRYRRSRLQQSRDLVSIDDIGHTIWVNVDSSDQPMKNDTSAQKKATQLIGSKQAAQKLGISLRTLYAYVSRGKIGRTLDADSGESLFNAEEVSEYVRKRDRGRQPSNVARASLNFGWPVLESHISAVKGGRPWFRGQDALLYSQNATLEETAALLWDVPALPAVAEDTSNVQVSNTLANAPFMHRFSDWLLQCMNQVPMHDHWSQHELVPHACRILRASAAIAVRQSTCAGNIHEVLATAWKLPQHMHAIVRRALVLHADHELNPSSFVVRCTASTTANPYAATLAGCCAASGSKHANFHDVYTLLGHATLATSLQSVVQRHIADSGALPGFNHPLYPKGDPRASVLLADLREVAPKNRMAPIDALLDLARSEHGFLPKNDFALAAMAQALDLAPEVCQILFVVGRVVGWNAHALEQYRSPLIIRPRAQYVPE